jgi:hypothetical protein
LRVLGEFVSVGVLSLSFSLPFLLVYRFSYHLLVLRVFFLLDDLLKLSFASAILVMLHVVLDSKFKLCAFVLSMYSSRGRLRNQVVSTLV